MPYEDQFAALAHPLRQQIIGLLQSDPASVSDLTEALDASQPVVSQHLKVLRTAGLVSAEAHGMKRIYALDPEALDALRAFLTEEWHAAFAKIGDTDNA